MNSTDLMFFAAVAEAGGIGRAAAALNTVQSNVTGRIRSLEQALHTPLFYRGTRGVTLTRAGERLLPYATQVARLLADAEQAVLSDETPRGPLRLGSMETTAALRLPRLLTAYAARYPEVDIELTLGPTEALIAAVLDRRVEGAFVSGPISQNDLAVLPMLEEELVLVAGARVGSHDEVVDLLASRREARVLVFKTGCSYRLRLEGFLAAHGLVHVRRMDFGTLDGIIGCVEAGMGVSLLPRIVAEPMQKSGRVSIHALPEGAGHAQTLVVHRKDTLLTAAFERFLDCAQNLFDFPPHDPVQPTPDSRQDSRVPGLSGRG
ncbi:LysR family transcriptional regulator [Methylobacterium terricola]|uniref:LysR family transcriptional regulator n=1 Tax=Methylobacterium terricola TaxID=2583531 RepID=A0A5C4L5J7_9HYPH|nr:LysR substrate-binding domain-containing protein [Methylobacterium terricola]TNC04973.1 LysR family transcriptional regulator [Methylobacterium terricola]